MGGRRRVRQWLTTEQATTLVSSVNAASCLHCPPGRSATKEAKVLSGRRDGTYRPIRNDAIALAALGWMLRDSSRTAFEARTLDMPVAAFRSFLVEGPADVTSARR